RLIILLCMLILIICLVLIFFFFFFNDTATPEIYTLSLHDALPIYTGAAYPLGTSVFQGIITTRPMGRPRVSAWRWAAAASARGRSEEHTSELQSRENLVCRLLLEKKKRKKQNDRRYQYNNRSYSRQ